MKWSVLDESLYSKMGCAFFRYLCEEFPELKEQAKDTVYEAAKLILELEHKFIDKMFEQGDLQNMKKEDLKNFIIKRINEKLVELGYEIAFKWDDESASNLDWFYHLTGGVTHTDFFAIRSTDYSKSNEGDDWEEGLW